MDRATILGKTKGVLVRAMVPSLDRMINRNGGISGRLSGVSLSYVLKGTAILGIPPAPAVDHRPLPPALVIPPTSTKPLKV